MHGVLAVAYLGLHLADLGHPERLAGLRERQLRLLQTALGGAEGATQGDGRAVAVGALLVEQRLSPQARLSVLCQDCRALSRAVARLPGLLDQVTGPTQRGCRTV